MKKISIQGKTASYSHIAANNYFGNDIELLERDTFSEVFEDLKNNSCDFIVVPIENSTYGSIYQNYDNLTSYDFHIIGEVYIKVNFHLIVNEGTKLDDIKKIYSHPVGLGQIKEFLKNHPKIKAEEYPDTAGAVKYIKDKNLLDSAAAASKFAGEFYEMEVLKENIHENPKNYTRFYILSKIENYPSDANKTTIQFVLGEEPGSLYKSLRSFADRDIALTKIESRPIINTDWGYRFYVDLMAGLEEEKFQNAIKEFQSYVKELRILGSYKKGEIVVT